MTLSRSSNSSPHERRLRAQMLAQTRLCRRRLFCPGAVREVAIVVQAMLGGLRRAVVSLWI